MGQTDASRCELYGSCAFINSTETGSKLSEFLKAQYCWGEHSGCARHMIASAMGYESVPADLLPNETDVARQIIDEA